jgi:hypothetical protein
MEKKGLLAFEEQAMASPVFDPVVWPWESVILVVTALKLHCVFLHLL